MPASMTTTKQSRFEILWSFPGPLFASPANQSGWWFDTIHADERAGLARLNALDKFATSCNGSVALYHVDYDGTLIVSERVIRRAGRTNSRTPPRAKAAAATASVMAAFEARLAAWSKGMEQSGAVQAGRRKTRTVETGKAMVVASALVALVLSGAAYLALTYRAPEGKEPLPGIVRMTETEARFARLTVPNDHGSCDAMKFDNRTGRTVYTGRVACEDQR